MSKKNKKYKPLKSFLKWKVKNDELFLNKDQMEEIIELALKQDGWEHNVGNDFKRLEHNPTEKAFHDEWLKENMPRPGINYGQGILQDLFIHQDTMFTRRWDIEVNNRERMIVATVIQWLGTNCGIAFLNQSLGRVGLKITDTNKPKDK